MVNIPGSISHCDEHTSSAECLPICTRNDGLESSLFHVQHLPECVDLSTNFFFNNKHQFDMLRIHRQKLLLLWDQTSVSCLSQKESRAILLAQGDIASHQSLCGCDLGTHQHEFLGHIVKNLLRRRDSIEVVEVTRKESPHNDRPRLVSRIEPGRDNKGLFC